ncbi:MAG TPA: aminoacyl-tRNA hydrolase [Gammaproteobacteria bacterium]|nr:aminoacyl-tRNA hydrolase [Gammaproteobacteria bacterium]|tara:strand:+ start:289 stop:879 length:591 start_codon:yes stop_codon:yes gene_type:complete
MAAISLVCGLGNPGAQYEATRHNAGFWFLDALERTVSLPWRPDTRFFGELADSRVGQQRVRFLRPNTFMNECGSAVAGVSGYFDIPPEAMLVVHDDLDLPPGTVRLKKGGGHGGHNGLRDIFSKLGSREFVRLRIGIGHPGNSDGVSDWVLRKPSAEDKTAILDAIDRALGEIDPIMGGDLEPVMKALHTQQKGQS